MGSLCIEWAYQYSLFLAKGCADPEGGGEAAGRGAVGGRLVLRGANGETDPDGPVIFVSRATGSYPWEPTTGCW